MCGIAGFIDNSVQHPDKVLNEMTGSIIHRGPDDAGHWYDTDLGIALGHRRLAILDLSAAGHQPMFSPSGRFVIVYNGEIYNHLKIRKELEKTSNEIHWRGHADTESMLAGFETWGIEATLRRCVGMFALAVWDKTQRTLTLARDRMGEKPLYYGWNSSAFLFSSELKALRAFPGFNSEINRDAITLLLRHNYIPAPHSIYRGIFKLWPGTIMTLQNSDRSICPWDVDEPPFEPFEGNGISLRPYWSLRDVAEQGQANTFKGTENKAVDDLERVLTDAILSQQISDVPLGAFLSGGVDSSTIVALMQSRSSRPVKTFTIGFFENDYNEAESAKDVARYLGTEHTELYVNFDDARNVIPMLPSVYDEPFADSSQIPTFLVAKLAKQHVTVALSGDGGDELFGGYSRYFQTRFIAGILTKFPLSGRRLLTNLMRFVSIEHWNQLLNPVMRYAPSVLRGGIPGDKIYKAADILGAKNIETFYRELLSFWKSPAHIVFGSKEPATVITNQTSIAKLQEFEHRMMYLDSMSYLPDDIMVKVDRAAMAVSLETRVPFLDHRVVEFAWQLPLSLKMRGNTGKWLLRQVLYKHVPPKMVDRPKTGFAISIDSWLRGPLREWGESLLDGRRLKQEGIFHVTEVRKKWNEHLSGARNWHYYLWSILMFQAWLEVNK